MRSTRIVTSFIRHNDQILILKRSEKVRSMKGLWSGVSGIIENNENPIDRAKIEIFEEVGIKEKEIRLVKKLEKMRIQSQQYKNHEWEIFPFLFETKNENIELNWENSEFKWILPKELKNYQTVPNLEKILVNLL
ncbi:NUDIX domain-containing protein [Nitrosopumilus sp.]|nr:NUDIX domain-containing protein [Nitrosopumilus sp.]